MLTISCIEKKSFFVIFSTRSDKAYLDKDRMCFVFLRKREAEEFIKITENTKWKEYSAIKKEEFASQLFHVGAEQVAITDRGSRKVFSLQEVGINPDLYTHELSGNVNLFLQTKNITYIKTFYNAYFFIPVRVKTLQTGPEIKYAIARTHKADNEEFWYLLFTDRFELEKWEKKDPTWDAIQISFDTVCQIGKKNGFLVNPLGKKFLLPPALLNKKNEEE